MQQSYYLGTSIYVIGNQYAKSEKVIKFWKLPSTLVICLKRFGYDRERDLYERE